MTKNADFPTPGFFAALILLLAGISSVSASEPLWTRVLAGDPVAGPVARNERVYVSGSDQTVTCLSGKGAFLWSKPLPGKALPRLTVTACGTVYAVSGNGTITALNGDGSFLWQLAGKEMPLFDPCEGRDGRFFLVYSNRIVCVSSSARILWRLPLDDRPTLRPSETGAGDLLLACSGGILLRISPFGELLEKIPLPVSPSALVPLDSGFAAGFPDGSIRYFDVRNKRPGSSKTDTELIREYKAGSPCLALAAGGGTLLSLQADGQLYGLNITDATLLWNAATGHRVDGIPFISWDYSQFNIAFPGYSCARLPSGKQVWELILPAQLTAPVVSASGLLYAAGPDWLLCCYRPETRIISEKKEQKTQTYSILNGKSDGYGMPFASDRQDIAVFFESVTESMASGTVGVNELAYARRLSEILRDDSGDYRTGRSFDPTERGRAASLLGQLGSAEYRTVLLDAADGDFDSSVAIGILYGLAALGYDEDGKSLEAIRHLVRSAGMYHPEVQRAACDALYAIVRYTGGPTALDAAREIAFFMESPYSVPVQEYARTVLGNILK